MIICGHSQVEDIEGGWRVSIDSDVGKALNLFPGQTLFGASPADSRRLFLSPLRLNPEVSFFRVFMEDVRGSLASVTKLFSDRGINVLSGGAFGFGNIWVSEYAADFKGIGESPEELSNEIQGLGGFVTTREITEYFPRAFELEETYKISSEDGVMHLRLNESASGVKGSTHAVLKAWANIQALFVDFFTPEEKLLRVTAKIKDVPGSLNSLAGLLGTQVNMHAIHEQHHDEVSGEWTIYGVLQMGTIEELKEKAGKAPKILEFQTEPLGWRG